MAKKPAHDDTEAEGDEPEHEHYEPSASAPTKAEQVAYALEEELGEGNGENITAVVKRVVDGRRSYLATLPLILGSLGDVYERIASQFFAGDYHIEYRVGGRFARSESFSVGPERQPPKGRPAIVPGAAPEQPAVSPEVLELRAELERARKREKRRAREAREAKEKAAADALAALSNEIKSLRERPPVAPAVAVGPSPDVAALRETVGALTSKLEAERDDRRSEERERIQREADGLRQQVADSEAATAKRMRLLRKKLAKKGKKAPSPLASLARTLGDVVQLKGAMATLNALGEDGGDWSELINGLAGPVKEFLTDFTRSTLASARERITTAATKRDAATAATTDGAKPAAENRKAFLDWFLSLFQKPDTVADPAAVADAAKKWPILLGRLSGVETKEQVREFAVFLAGEALAKQLDTLDEQNINNLLLLIRTLKATLAGLAAKPAAPETETASESKPAASAPEGGAA